MNGRKEELLRLRKALQDKITRLNDRGVELLNRLDEVDQELMAYASPKPLDLDESLLDNPKPERKK
jgi:hypothetical protein